MISDHGQHVVKSINLLYLGLEVCSDRVLVGQEQIQCVVLLCLIIVRHALAQETDRPIRK